MKKTTILVVDEEPFFRHLYAEILQEDSYLVETATTGDEALDRLLQGGVDVVLTDLVMPGLSGLEVLRQARSMNNPPEVIIATGHPTLDTAIQALKNGARDYLVKPFNPEELRNLVRSCLEQRRLLDENSLLKSQIRLFQKGQALACQLEAEGLLPRAIDTLLGEIGEGRGFAFILENDQAARIFPEDEQSETEKLALADSLLPHLENAPGIRLLKDADLPEGIETLLLFPLRCEKTVKGAIVLYNPKKSDFNSSLPLENLQFLCEQTALGFDNACRYQGAKELIYVDDLTGLYNSRYLEIALDQEISRTERYGLDFSLAFIDLDHFKQVNDTHGHLAGSQALREVASLLRRSVREVDILFRYGGDEFTALLVGTDTRGAAAVSERIRKEIEKHTFFTESGVKVKLTVTVGYATYPLQCNDRKDLIDLADRAMYYGKKVRNVSRGAAEIK